MNIILIIGNRKRRLSLSLGPVSKSLLGLITCSIITGLVYSGYFYAEHRTGDILKGIHNSTSSEWQFAINGQQEQLDLLQIDSEKSLNAMASRLSIMQGHILRLDALGSRLSSMAEIDDFEFDAENTPGMGGPENISVMPSIDVIDFMEEIKKMALIIDDRQEKLTAIETLLVNSSLQDQIVPEGHPAVAGWVSSRYGYRNDPVTGQREFHAGLDFAGKPGTPVTTVAAGIVTWSGLRDDYGNIVEISHGNGYMTRYAHNDKNLVSVGEKVEKGGVIAIMGNSGRSTGTHVHFEVLYEGRSVNPGKYLVLK